MIKILHIVPDIDGGGVGSVVYNYMTHMNRKEIHVEIVTDDHGYQQLLKENFETFGIIVKTIVPRKKNIIKHFKEIMQIIKNGNYDVVHCHQQNWAVFYLIIARLYNVKKRIAHSHTTMQNENILKIKILDCFKPLLKLVSTGHFACSKAAGIYMWGKKYMLSKKMYIMNNAVDTNEFKFDSNMREKYRKELGIINKFVIGHIGRFSLQKNHKFLIDIFYNYSKYDNNAILILVGQGELEKKIKSKVNELGLTEKVLFLGLRNDISKLINAFDLFVLPSLYEGLPVVGVEMQTNGIPCLFSEAITDEVLFQDNSKRLPLNKINKWVEEITFFCKSEKNENYRKKAYVNTIKSCFDIDMEAEKLRKYYIK